MVFHEDGRFRGLIGRNSIMGTLEKIRLFRNLAGAVRDPSLYRISMESWLERVEVGEGARKFFVGLAIGLMASTHLERLSMGELLQFLRTAVRKRRPSVTRWATGTRSYLPRSTARPALSART